MKSLATVDQGDINIPKQRKRKPGKFEPAPSEPLKVVELETRPASLIRLEVDSKLAKNRPQRCLESEIKTESLIESFKNGRANALGKLLYIFEQSATEHAIDPLLIESIKRDMRKGFLNETI